jgi:guanylate kinase
LENGKLIIFSAPSGSGKTTVVKYLLNSIPELAFSISATTRHKRPGEIDGRDYYFLSPEEFRKKIDNGEFLEYEEVYNGLYYGTLRSEIERLWDGGHHVVFDVDVEGGLNIKKQFGDRALAVFLRPPGMQVLMARLKARDTEVEHHLQERIDKALHELKYEDQFDVVIINNILEDTFSQSEEVVRNFIGKP